MKLIPAKTRGIGQLGLPYGENFIILPSAVFDRSTHVTDRWTDGRTDDNALSMSNGYTVVSRMVTFPDGFFPGKTFPGKSFPG